MNVASASASDAFASVELRAFDAKGVPIKRASVVVTAAMQTIELAAPKIASVELDGPCTLAVDDIQTFTGPRP